MGIPASELTDQLARITKSKYFASSRRLPDFLNYVVEQTISGNSRKIKQYPIAIEVYDRPSTFDPKSDPLIRIEAGRLRRALRKYYDVEGQYDPILIEIPVGSYRPRFEYISNSPDYRYNNSIQSSSTSSTFAPPVIAVFPFLNQGDKHYDYLVNGIGEELTGELSLCNDMDVIAFNSTVHTTGSSPDIMANAASLGANFAISGTLRNSGNSFRFNINLFDVESKKQLWKERFEAELIPEKLFQMEDTIVSHVLARITDSYGIIFRKMCSRADSYRVTEQSAYLAILRYLDYQLSLSPESYKKCMASLQSATEKEPNSATVWAMLSQMYLDAVVFGYDDVPDARRNGLLYASRAISLDCRCQYAQHAMAFACMISHDRQGMIKAADRIMEINSNSAFMQGAASFWYCIAGDYKKGMQLYRASTRLNPFFPSWLHAGPYFYYLSKGDYEHALYHANELGLPDFFWGPLMRAVALSYLDRNIDAQKMYAETQKLNENFSENKEYYLSYFILNKSLLNRMLKGIQNISTVVSHSQKVDINV